VVIITILIEGLVHDAVDFYAELGLERWGQAEQGQRLLNLDGSIVSHELMADDIPAVLLFRFRGEIAPGEYQQYHYQECAAQLTMGLHEG
jgi:hypothetical protein